MIASWMLYAFVVGGLVTLAAAAADRVATTRGWPVRFIWLGAMVLSIAWPVGNAVRRLMPTAAEPVTVLPFTITLQPMVSSAADTPDRAALLDRGLLALWIGVSALLVFRLAQAVFSLKRTRDGWHVGDVDGTRVRLSENVGPAVVGLRSMDVVLPEWIMSLDAPLRAIVLRHEEEHRSARDPYLLFAAGIAVALMPWNLALWLQERRLRLAIEMDCDGRVLRAHPSPERYGMLMLTIAQRRSISPAMFAPMLSEPATQLEQRIIAMRTKTHRLARLTVYGGVTIAATALLFACALEEGPTSPTSPMPSASRTVSKGPRVMTDSQTYFEFQVEKQVSPYPGNTAPRYPDMLRSANIEGEVLAQFVMDTSGHADMRTFKVLKSTHDLFTASVRGSLPTMRFYPAQVGGKKVKQLVQMPFQFSLTHDVSKADVARKPERVEVRVPPRSNEVLKLDRVNVEVPRQPQPMSANQTYFEFQVERQATPRPDNIALRYPDMLRSANVEGQVLAQFTVDANGVPDSSTIKVLKSTHDLFTQAVLSRIPSMRFYPATVGGRPVKALIQMPFDFSLTK